MLFAGDEVSFNPIDCNVNSEDCATSCMREASQLTIAIKLISQEIDGTWEPPLIKNPKCISVSGCGKWKPPLIDNPKFKGKCK